MIKIDPAKLGLVPTVWTSPRKPQRLSFKELDAAQLPRFAGGRWTAALINTDYAIASGLSLPGDFPSLWKKRPTNPYVNVSRCAEGPGRRTLVQDTC